MDCTHCQQRNCFFGTREEYVVICMIHDKIQHVIIYSKAVCLITAAFSVGIRWNKLLDSEVMMNLYELW